PDHSRRTAAAEPERGPGQPTADVRPHHRRLLPAVLPPAAEAPAAGDADAELADPGNRGADEGGHLRHRRRGPRRRRRAGDLPGNPHPHGQGRSGRDHLPPGARRHHPAGGPPRLRRRQGRRLRAAPHRSPRYRPAPGDRYHPPPPDRESRPPMTADVKTLIDRYVRDVPDYPQPGVVFKDITPLLAHPAALAAAVDAIVEPLQGRGIDLVAGLEARGFIFGAPAAVRLGAGFVPLRKAGKLPARTLAESYDLEYGTATVEMHADAVTPGSRVLVVDDVLATGGTGRAAVDLIRRAGGTVVEFSVLLELGFLKGR